ncbi:MAG: hypothetical protein MUD03_16435 [Pirellula sp.]|nr:hypothetical protein [Pirellula sp.]
MSGNPHHFIGGRVLGDSTLIRHSYRWVGLVPLMLPMLGCTIVRVPAGSRLHDFQSPASLHSCSASELAVRDYEGSELPECHPILDDLRPVKPELIPARVKDAGFQLYARTCDLKDRCQARHAASCEGWKIWFQTKVKPPKEPPWPKFHPVPAAPAFTPREDEVEAIELPQG